VSALKPVNPFRAELLPMPPLALVLAVALTHRTIQIYTRSPSIEQSQASTSAAASVSFHQAIALEGHEDWVRCLSFSVFPKSMNSAEQDLMLASGSQDGYIRLWRVSRLANQDPNHADTRTMNGELDASVLNDEMLDEFERRMRGEGGLDADGQGGAASQLSTKAHGLRVVSAAG
jgi:elongator complex protein 2